jgi:hypothetical protein
MERKQITEEQKEILTNWKLRGLFDADMTDNGTVYHVRMGDFYHPFEEYCKVAELDYKTMMRLDDIYSGDIAYSMEDGLYVVCCTTWLSGNRKESLSVELTSEEDFLGFYGKKAEADSSQKSFFDDSIENIVSKLRETYPDVVENIEQNVIRNIRGYDLDDSDIEYFADDWIKDNPRIAVDEAESYLTEEEQADIVKEWSDSLSSEDTKDLIVRLVDNL